MNDPEITSKKRNPRVHELKQLLLFIILPSALFIALCFLILPDPSRDNLRARIHAAQKTGNNIEAALLLEKLLVAEPENVALHNEYIHTAHKNARREEAQDIPDASRIVERYTVLLGDENPARQDIGFYGLGLLHLLNRDYEKSIWYFKRVSNSNMKYFNNSIGYAYQCLGRHNEAEYHFRRELDLRGNMQGALDNLMEMLLHFRRFDDMKRLLDDPGLKEYQQPSLLRILALHDRQPGLYLPFLFRQPFQRLSVVGLVGAVFGCLIWAFFLRRLDVFEPERPRFLALAFAGGMLAFFFALFLYDLVHCLTPLRLNGSWRNDLVYCIAVIGGIEELAKIIPFLLLLRFSSQVNETVDYIIYASMVALGAAFIENIQYFSPDNLRIMEGRTLLSITSHMVETSIIAWGFVLARRRGSSPLLVFLLFYVAACVLHGLFDFFLLCDALPLSARGFTFCTLLVELLLYREMIIVALSRSEFYDDSRSERLSTIRRTLGILLTGVILVQFALLSWSFGPRMSLEALLMRIPLSIFMIYVFSFNIPPGEVRRRNRLLREAA